MRCQLCAHMWVQHARMVAHWARQRHGVSSTSVGALVDVFPTFNLGDGVKKGHHLLNVRGDFGYELLVARWLHAML